MTEEVRLWRVSKGSELRELSRSPLNLEARLEDWLALDISILDPRLLVIGRQVATDFGGSIDLLCLDGTGDIVVVELKRDKTPREITAQVLDYGSWIKDLSNERITALAQAHFGQIEFEEAFKRRFGADLPETLGEGHRLLIVGSEIDASSERIIKYLSESYGVNINAATFQYFQDEGESEFLARVFLIEPAEAELHARTKGSSKRRPNLTYEELIALAAAAGVEELYGYAVSIFEPLLRKHTTQSSIAFTALFNGSRKTVISLLPGKSAEGKVRYQLYKNRYAELTRLSADEVESLMPANHEPWAFAPTDRTAGPDWEGFQGFIANREEIERIAKALPAPGG